MVKPGDTVYYGQFSTSIHVISPEQLRELIDGCEVKTIRDCGTYLDYAPLPGGVMVLVDMGKDGD